MATIDPGELFPGHVPDWCHSNWETSIIHSTCMEQLLLICHKDNPRIRMCLSESWTIIFMSSVLWLYLIEIDGASFYLSPNVIFIPSNLSVCCSIVLQNGIVWEGFATVPKSIRALIYLHCDLPERIGLIFCVLFHSGIVFVWTEIGSKVPFYTFYQHSWGIEIKSVQPLQEVALIEKWYFVLVV